MPVSAAELEELTLTRCWMEERALRESIARRTAEWEEQLVLALHRLGRASRLSPQSPSALNPDWEKVHRTFHRVLISACRSHWLVGFCDQLSDHAAIGGGQFRQISANLGRRKSRGHTLQSGQVGHRRLLRIEKRRCDGGGNEERAVREVLCHHDASLQPSSRYGFCNWIVVF